jgi:hypothetical protein
MAGFEVVVRPAVFPNIRPVPTRSLAPEDNSESGFATFSGSSGQVIALTHSFSASGSRPVETEFERVVDEVEVSEDNFDTQGGGGGGGGGGGAKFTTQVAKKIRTRNPDGSTATYNYRPVDETETVIITHKNMQINSLPEGN